MAIRPEEAGNEGHAYVGFDGDRASPTVEEPSKDEQENWIDDAAEESATGDGRRAVAWKYAGHLSEGYPMLETTDAEATCLLDENYKESFAFRAALVSGVQGFRIAHDPGHCDDFLQALQQLGAEPKICRLRSRRQRLPNDAGACKLFPRQLGKGLRRTGVRRGTRRILDQACHVSLEAFLPRMVRSPALVTFSSNCRGFTGSS